MEIVLTWQFVLASVAIYAIISTFKRIAKIYVITSNPLYKTFITLLNIGIGILIAIPPGFLPSDNIYKRIILGIVAGFFSNYAYQMVKRFMKGETKNE